MFCVEPRGAEVVEDRYYQTDARAMIAAAREAGEPAALVVLPTGVGKTLVMTEEASDEVARGGKVLIVAHRNKLFEQTKKTLLGNDPDLDIGIVGFKHAEWSHAITLGGVQTLSMSEERLARLESEGITLVIWDECHRAFSKSYRRVWKHLTSAFHEGYTATPDRHNGPHMRVLFGDPVYERPIDEMIVEEWLASPRVHMIKTSVPLGGVSLHGKDYDQESLAAAINRIDRNDIIVQTFIKHQCQGKATIAFCANKAHARALAETFLARGISAKALTDDVVDEEEDQVYADFETGAITVLTSVSKVEEGFDAHVEVILLCAPTQSRPRYQQRIGRGTRKHFGKTHFDIFDFTDDCETHSLQPVEAKDVFNLPHLEDGEDVGEAIKKERKKREAATNTPQDDAKPKVNEGIEGGTIVERDGKIVQPLTWNRVEGGGYQLQVGKNRLVVMPDNAGGYTVGMILKEHALAKEKLSVIERGLSPSTAQAIAETKARLLQKGAFHLVDPNAAWRSHPMSPKTRAALEKFHVTHAPDILQGPACDLLEKEFARRKQKSQFAKKKPKKSA